jgi:tRNA nucleotidyltransferase (CCA-adding enzyme)
VAPDREIDPEALEGRITALPGFDALRDAVAETGLDAYLVGGSVRDAMLGLERADLDVVVDGDHLALAIALGDDRREHDRFDTATVATATGSVDVARARDESYPHPGALPEVEPAGLDEDLARRDFSINAMAIAIVEPGELIDPQGGLADLTAGTLRALHDGSLADDPTRALRAARYAARLELEVEPATLEQIRAADLRTVSEDRARAELLKLAVEPKPRLGFELLDEWGLVPLPAGAGELIDVIVELVCNDPWTNSAQACDEAVLAAASGQIRRPEAVAAIEPSKPSEGAAAAQGLDGAELLIARALGAAWLDDYVSTQSGASLEISGQDLLDAGIEPGPAIGRGLDEAYRALLDGEAPDRDRQLEVAVEAARQTPT